MDSREASIKVAQGKPRKKLTYKITPNLTGGKSKAKLKRICSVCLRSSQIPDPFPVFVFLNRKMTGIYSLEKVKW